MKVYYIMDMRDGKVLSKDVNGCHIFVDPKKSLGLLYTTKGWAQKRIDERSICPQGGRGGRWNPRSVPPVNEFLKVVEFELNEVTE